MSISRAGGRESIGPDAPLPPRRFRPLPPDERRRGVDSDSSSSAAGNSVSARARRRIGRQDFSSNCQSADFTTNDCRRGLVKLVLKATSRQFNMYVSSKPLPPLPLAQPTLLQPTGRTTLN